MARRWRSGSGPQATWSATISSVTREAAASKYVGMASSWLS